MYPTCMPGDLAVVVFAHNPSNIGRLVKVLRLHANQQELQTQAGDCLWTVRATHHLTYRSDGVRKRRTGPVPDSALKPIRGQPIGHDIALFVELMHLRRQGPDQGTASLLF